MPGVRLEDAFGTHTSFKGELRGMLQPMEGPQSRAKLSFTYRMDSREKRLRRHKRQTDRPHMYISYSCIR